MNAPSVHFIMVWVGEKYGLEYPRILADQIIRNASQVEEFALWCVTDRPDELPEGIAPIQAHPDLPGWWQKLYLFSPDMPWVEGDRLVYFDLDVAITGRLEDLVERSGIISDWHWAPMFNSSVMSWLHGDHRDIWVVYSIRPETIHQPSDPDVARLLPAGQINGGDQEFISYVSQCGKEPWDTFPDSWFVSYRDAKAWPPNGCKAVILHGSPKPHEVTEGWLPNVWKVGGYTSLPVMNGVNVTHDAILANVRSSVQRDLPWFSGFGEHKGRAVIVGGAPSLTDTLVDIRAQKRTGGKIIALNNAWRALSAAGVATDILVLLDARQENAAFVRDLPLSVKCFVASQCHPDVFDALSEHEVVVWHNGFGTNEALKEVLAPWWDEGPEQRPCVLVPGGGTVGLRALWLCAFSGYRTIHMYGVDSSFSDTGQHHAYAQPLNDGDSAMEVVLVINGGERRYRAAPWMVRQVEELKETWADLRKEGVTIHAHGKGLLPDVARILREEERAA